MKKLNPYTKQKNAWRKRRELAQVMHYEGFTLSEIGAKIGCSKQRVHQLLRYMEAKA
jgi:DNA-directed RNA polymerase specialized sigma subunit